MALNHRRKFVSSRRLRKVKPKMACVAVEVLSVDKNIYTEKTNPTPLTELQLSIIDGIEELSLSYPDGSSHKGRCALFLICIFSPIYNPKIRSRFWLELRKRTIKNRFSDGFLPHEEPTTSDLQRCLYSLFHVKDSNLPRKKKVPKNFSIQKEPTYSIGGTSPP